MKMKPAAWLLITIITFFQSNEAISNPDDQDRDSLASGIAEIISHPDVEGSTIAISIRDGDDGSEIFTHNGDARLQPASGMKLVTAASALHLLGPDYRFSTEVYTDGEKIGNVLTGNVYLKGKGDPTLQPMDLAWLAEELKKKGIAKIIGNLVADDSWYDDERLSIDMPWSDEQHYYGAPISALTVSFDQDFDAGAVEVIVKPGTETGKPLDVAVTPKTHFIKVNNAGETGIPGSPETLEVTRAHGIDEIVIEGSLPYGGENSKTRISVWNPTMYAIDLFSQSLEEKQIVWTGKQTCGIVPDHAVLLAKDQSDPLSDIFIPFMKLSNNTIAEGLVKEVGRVKREEGSWPAGLKAIHDELDYLDIDPAGIKMRDGSGLSPLGMVTAKNLTCLLYKAQSEFWFPIFEKSLPVAGNSEKMIGGTLRKRMVNTLAEGNVRAKTGTISFNSSLSGYVTTKNGKRLVFSVIINNGLDEKRLKKIEDRFAVYLAELTI